MFWSLRQFLGHIALTWRRRARWASECAAEARWRLRSRLAMFAPQRLIASLSYLVTSLVFGHRRRQFVLAWLSVFVLGCCVVGLSFGVALYHERTIVQSVVDANDATAHGDYVTAVDRWQRVVELGGSQNEHRLHLVEAYDRAGMTADRDTLLAELAPENRRGYPPAYYFAIRRDIRADDLSAERLASITRELDWLSEMGLDEGELAELRTACCLRMGRLSDAQELLRSAHVSPMIRVVAARTFASLDMRDVAMSQAKIASQELAERLAKRDTVAERLLWAEAEGIVGNPRDVEAILRTGASLHPQGPFTRELARLQLQLISDPTIDSDRKAVLIEGGLRLLARLPADDSALLTLMWRFHLAHGDSQRAAEALSASAMHNSRMRLDLARFEATHGGVETSRARATTVAEDCRVAIAASPNRRSIRLLYAEALVFLRDYEGATATLDEAWQRIHDSEYAVALSRTYLAWWDAKVCESEAVSADDVELLEKAARYCPTSIELAKRLRKARNLLAASDNAARKRLDALAKINFATSDDSKL